MSFSLLGVSSWSPSLLRGFLRVKALSTCWTSDGGAFGVVTFLKAHWWRYISARRWKATGGLAGRLGAGGEFEGGCLAHAAETKIILTVGVVTWMLDLAACSRLWRLTLLGKCQCGVGLRRKAALAAPSSWDGLVCSGLWRVAQLCLATPVWYIVERWRKRQLGLLVWRRRLLRGWRNVSGQPAGAVSAV